VRFTTDFQRLSTRARRLGTTIFLLTFIILFGINVFQILTLPNPLGDLGIEAGFPFTCYVKGGYVGTQEFVVVGIVLNYLFACLVSLALSYAALKAYEFFLDEN
jgi:predicted membrane protein